MKKLLLLSLSLVIILLGHAQIPSAYYDAADGKSGEALRQALRDIITNGHVKLPYTSSSFDVWDAYAVTDERPAPNNNYIWDMYSDIPNGTPAYYFTIYTNQCGTAAKEGDCYSREHLMPNSWWGGIDNSANPQYTDLHHLFPADQYVNNRKSAHVVAETTNPTWTSTNGSKVGPCSLEGYTGTIFEPVNEYKGDFARAFLYLATRYMDDLSNWVTDYPSTEGQYIINTSGGDYKDWYINMLIAWHTSDPVSQKEINRNDSIYYSTPQHNRNPFIDNPDYAYLIWGYPDSPVITQIEQTPEYPGATDVVSISATITDDNSISSAILQWCIDGSSFDHSITMNQTEELKYTASSTIPAQTAGTTVTYHVVATDNDDNSSNSLVYSYTVIKDEPSDYPTSFTCGTGTSSTITLTWIDASNNITPDGYLVKGSSVSFEAITDPTDGIQESSSSLTGNVDAGLQTIKFSGLNSSTTYYFKIFPYTNSLSSINYKTDASVPNTTCSTIAGSAGSNCATDLIISEYVEGSSNNKYIELYNNTGSAIDLSDYKLQLYSNGSSSASSNITLSGTLNDKSTIVYKNSSATAYIGTATTNAAVNFNGDDAVALYKTSTASYVDIFGRIGEDPGDSWAEGTYSTANSTLVRNSSVTTGITSNPSSGFPTLTTEWTTYSTDEVSYLGAHTMNCQSCITPTSQADNITFSDIASTQMTINWTNGDGEKRLVVLSQEYPVSESPVDGFTYDDNSNYGDGSEMAPDEFVVYNNSGSSVTVSNLIAGQTYYVSVFEYNCDEGSELYLTPGVTASQITYSLTTENTSEDQFCVTTTMGYATTIDFYSCGTFTENTYAAQLSDEKGSFNSPITIGTLVSNLNNGTINCTIPANTASGSGYLIRIISNGPTLTGTSSAPFSVTLDEPCQAPTEVIANRNNICENEGGSIDLSISGGSGTVVKWYTSENADSLLGTGTSLTVAAPSVTTSYFARWENICTSSDFIQITVTVLPVSSASVNIEASATEFCEGTEVTFTATTINGGNSPEYTWYLNGTTIFGESQTTYISNSFSNEDFVKCSIISNQNCLVESEAVSDSILLTVYAIPETPVIQLNENVLSSDALSGNQWYNQDGLIEGETNQNYAVSTTGDYFVIVTNNTCNSDTSNIIHIEYTSIGFIANNGLVRIYPNPVTNLLTIEVDYNSEFEFDLFNLIGEKIASGNFIGKTTLNTGNYVPGVYIIEIKDGENNQLIKFIKAGQ